MRRGRGQMKFLTIIRQIELEENPSQA